MHLALDPRDPRPLYQQIVDEIRRLIVLGQLRPHDPLPSVRTLATDVRVNPNTVQQAYRELERTGLVYVQRTQGSFVAERAVSQAERASLVQQLAERMAQEAYRNGIPLLELAAALERLEHQADEGAGEKSR
jgi:GntR family transcriptional regulator